MGIGALAAGDQGSRGAAVERRKTGDMSQHVVKVVELAVSDMHGQGAGAAEVRDRLPHRPNEGVVHCQQILYGCVGVIIETIGQRLGPVADVGGA